MNKFNTILTVAAVALTSVFGFTSCDKNDPLDNPGPGTHRPEGPGTIITPSNPDNQMLNSTLEYEFSVDALSMVDVSYEITDFNGAVETFDIKEPCKVTKSIGSTKSLNAAAKVKVIVTPKEGLGEDVKTCDIAFYSEVKGYISSDNYPDAAFTVNNPNNLLKCNYGKTRISPQTFAKTVAGTYEITIRK